MFITGYSGWDWIFIPVWRFHLSHMCMARLLLGNSIKHGLFYLQHTWGLSITSVFSSCSLYHCYHVYSILLKWLLCNINSQRLSLLECLLVAEMRTFLFYCLIVFGSNIGCGWTAAGMQRETAGNLWFAYTDRKSTHRTARVSCYWRQQGWATTIPDQTGGMHNSSHIKKTEYRGDWLGFFCWITRLSCERRAK